MRKQTVVNIVLCAMLMTLLLALSGCSGSKLSGKYINESNETEYLEFSGNSFVLRSGDNPSLSGDYTFKGNNLILSFDMGPYYSDETLSLNSGKTSISYGGTNYVKEKGFWGKHWLKFVIGFVIIGVIGMIYEKKTGRDFSDDIDSLGDRAQKAIDDALDKDK